MPRLGHCGAGIKARRHFRSAIERSELAAPLRGNFDAAVGATLEAVGTVLRHRSLDMTAHYAKVGIAMLEQIAQPWPGELTC
ncbi:hypothetical protein [Leisingera aquimarina]|uniref:hypothetical protein n=1 Tax=Leisingera aquimarina TaxID=476529 RepID=UPI0004863CAA|nr:hypothetical protein [Leisingera aquimarina]